MEKAFGTGIERRPIIENNHATAEQRTQLDISKRPADTRVMEIDIRVVKIAMQSIFFFEVDQSSISQRSELTER